MANHNSKKLHPNVKDLTGKRFGRLVVLRFGKSQRRNVRWICRCDCGEKSMPFGQSLTRGQAKSCGCLGRELAAQRHTTHGESDPPTPMYRIYRGMIQRCCDPTNKKYHCYGGRGIAVCRRWLKNYVNFRDDIMRLLGPRPPKHSIDRINNNGNYCPSNVRWSTQAAQVRNTRRSVLLTFNGRTQNIKDWDLELGFSSGVLRHRIKEMGWSVTKSLTTPLFRAR